MTRKTIATKIFPQRSKVLSQDWSNPFGPKEVGYCIPAGNSQRFCTQSNEVFVDQSTGLVYMTDHWGLGMHILEFKG